MDEGLPIVGSLRVRRLLEKFREKAYRDSYVASHTRNFLARQMRKLRGDKSQTEFGALLGKKQTVVSRLEDPKYGKWTLQTLFEVAERLNIAVIVRFVDFPTFLRMSDDMSEGASSPQPYDQGQIEEALAPRRMLDQSRLPPTSSARDIEHEPIVIPTARGQVTVSAVLQ